MGALVFKETLKTLKDKNKRLTILGVRRETIKLDFKTIKFRNIFVSELPFPDNKLRLSVISLDIVRHWRQ